MRSTIVACVCIQVLRGSTVIDAFATQGQISFYRHGDNNSFIRRLNVAEESHESSGDNGSDSAPVMSKAKWKKKRYLMMQDVIDLIDQRDRRAPRKAQEIVSRMQKLSEVHQDDTMKPDEQVYNVRLFYFCHRLVTC